MYYLLENNRIIDSENYKEPYILSKDVIRNREVLFLTSFKDQVLVKGLIKKQSENVFDLIEKGDLVRCLNDIYEIKHVYYNNDGVFQYVTSGCGICFPSWKNFLKELNAIYKPNSKGDYIKVWEKKN